MKRILALILISLILLVGCIPNKNDISKGITDGRIRNLAEGHGKLESCPIE